jgi:DNA-binding NarL/FixJ family response regulator
MPTDAIQIVLVDDHRLFRSGLVSLINSLGGYKILFEAANGEELTRKLSPQLKPDIILLDINMPVMGGIETARWLKANYPDICVIVLSMFEDAEKVLTMVKLGVKGYLLKDSPNLTSLNTPSARYRTGRNLLPRVCYPPPGEQLQPQCRRNKAEQPRAGVFKTGRHRTYLQRNCRPYVHQRTHR